MIIKKQKPKKQKKILTNKTKHKYKNRDIKHNKTSKEQKKRNNNKKSQ